jgi:DNA repair protein RadC
MPITDWPEAERPREKLIAKGAESLSDSELLAIFLRTGIKNKSAVDVARELMTHFGSLSAVLAAPQATLCAMPGMGVAKYVQLRAGVELAKRALGLIDVRVLDHFIIAGSSAMSFAERGLL